jgi:hypothetical protein
MSGGLSIRALMTLKIAGLAPMPKASVTTAMRVKPGFSKHARAESRILNESSHPCLLVKCTTGCQPAGSSNYSTGWHPVVRLRLLLNPIAELITKRRAGRNEKLIALISGFVLSVLIAAARRNVRLRGDDWAQLKVRLKRKDHKTLGFAALPLRSAETAPPFRKRRPPSRLRRPEARPQALLCLDQAESTGGL